MNSSERSGTYRQLYHAANGLESRFLRPSSSSVSRFRRSDSGPSINSKLIGVALTLGVSLAAVFAAINSLGEDSKESEDQDQPVVDEEGAPIEVPNVSDSVPELEDESLLNRILSFLGLSSSEEDPGIVEEPSATETTTVPVATAEVKDSAPAVPTANPPSDTNSPPPILVSRGRTLDKKNLAERSSQSENSLFVGRYARLSKANLSPEELTWAVKLVRSGASISGRMGRSFLPLVKSLITQRALAYGLVPEDMIKVASMESGGDPNAVSSTGAIGVYQFTSATARAFGLNNRFDLDANVEAGMQLTRANLKSLPSKVSGPLAVYIAHQIGIGGAREVLNSPPNRPISKLRPGTQRSIRVNVGGKSRTVGEYLAANRAKLESTYEAQVAAAPFRGKIDIRIADAGSPRGSTVPAKVSLPPAERVSSIQPVTAVVPDSTGPVPDQTYHAKIPELRPISEASSETPPEETSFSLGSPTAEEDQMFQTAFVSNNGALVVM